MRQVPSAVSSVVCGTAHCVALCKEGDVVTWGCGIHGEMGVSAPIAYAAAPQIVPLASILHPHEFVRIIRAGSHRSALVTSENRVFLWGNNELKPPYELYSVPAGEGDIIDIEVGDSILVLVDVLAQNSQEDLNTDDTLHHLLLQSHHSKDPHYNRTLEKSRSQSMAWCFSKDSFIRRVLQQRQLYRSWNEECRSGMAFHPSHALNSLIEKGIPPFLRQRIWPLLLGNVLKVTPEAFHLYWSRALANQGSAPQSGLGKEATVQLIDEDLKRTFVPLGFFNRGEPLYDVIRKMLLTYAYYRPDIGYVQGMSFLAGILAVHISDDYLCFQCLANLLGSEHLYAFYSLKVGFYH